MKTIQLDLFKKEIKIKEVGWYYLLRKKIATRKWIRPIFKKWYAVAKQHTYQTESNQEKHATNSPVKNSR